MTTWTSSVATDAARQSSRTSWCGFWLSMACYRSSWMPSSKPSSACTGAQPCCWPPSTCLISWTSRPIGTRYMMQICITPGIKTVCSCAPGWTWLRTNRSYSTSTRGAALTPGFQWWPRPSWTPAPHLSTSWARTCPPRNCSTSRISLTTRARWDLLCLHHQDGLPSATRTQVHISCWTWINSIAWVSCMRSTLTSPSTRARPQHSPGEG